MIQRYNSIGRLCPEGTWVTYDDHTAALAAERAKVRELVEALNLAIVHKYTHDGRILLEKYKEEQNNE